MRLIPCVDGLEVRLALSTAQSVDDPTVVIAADLGDAGDSDSETDADTDATDILDTTDTPPDTTNVDAPAISNPAILMMGNENDDIYAPFPDDDGDLIDQDVQNPNPP